MFKKLEWINDFSCGRWRLYKLDKKISKGMKGNIMRPLSTGGFEEAATEYFVVSDARTHIERLVFPIWLNEGYDETDLLKGVEGCAERGIACAGEMTMMICGGDPSTIKPDEDYLKELLEVNNIKTS